MAQKHFQILLGILNGFLFTVLVSSEPQHAFMTHYFYNRLPLFVNDSMLLELTNKPLSSEPDKDYLTCDVSIMTSPGRKLLVHFMALAISDDNKIDRLHIFDTGDPKTSPLRVTPRQGLYGVYDKYYQGLSHRVPDFVSNGTSFKFDYQGKPTLAYYGFRILVTSIRASRGDCGRGYVMCHVRRVCIPASTWCDGYNNCGRGDTSDEDRCDRHVGTWEPVDGQVTAVVTASVACALLLVSAVVAVLVVMKINKRELQREIGNIPVEYRRQKSKQTKQSDLPPSYEVVIGMNEDPPPYNTVAEEYITETDDDSDLEHFAENSPTNARVSIPDHNRQSVDRSNNVAEETVTAAQVVCDIEGNQTSNCPNNPDDNNKQVFQDMTNYRLCSEPCQNSPLPKQRKVVVRGASTLDEIEVLPLDERDSLLDHSKPNGHTVRMNGHAIKENLNPKLSNGHSVVKYKRSPSKRETAEIEYIDSD